jgi:hypothetical protein
MIKVVYGFTWITQVILVYGFSEFFFLIELEFVIIYVFSRIVKKIVLKKHVIKLYKVHKSVYMFGWLTLFAGLERFFFISSIDIGLIENLIS